MNEIDLKLLPELFNDSIKIINDYDPDNAVYQLGKKGIPADWTKLIIIAALKRLLSNCKESLKKSRSMFSISLIVFPIGLFITIWTFMQHAGVFLVAIGPIVIGGGFLVYSIRDLYVESIMKRELTKELEKMGEEVQLVSDSGSYIAYRKLDLTKDIIDFVNSQYNGLFKSNKIMSIEATSVSGEFYKMICIDSQLSKETINNIAMGIYNNFNEKFAIFDSNSILSNWINSSYELLKKNNVC
jgi:hypothetical protein